ncbi:hypothetical protein KIPB_006384 [Kipferlia bialata]|uniref:Uncharacterized protein n=1 Tax=Kipferlia bialata TaxID=797122 RepID=A0A391NKZ4_9EUKA|nr:hypothetical protein KIPB_005091 [Kipferlia bialata]GCA62795.1 hypothetical protein KIPB_005860 [Kipferlia bialata]GCA62883.1 hypothetical protein KIPB_006384 [Kipferlia bialata]|eukprot:g5091.t1
MYLGTDTAYVPAVCLSLPFALAVASGQLVPPSLSLSVKGVPLTDAVLTPITVLYALVMQGVQGCVPTVVGCLCGWGYALTLRSK